MSITLSEDKDPSFQLEVEVAKSLCETVDTPRSLAVYLLLSYREFGQYLDLTCDPDNYDDTGNFADDYLVSEILRKSPLLPVQIDRREAAQTSFWMSELGCYATNIRLKTETFNYEHAVRRRISDILGPLDLKALREIEENFGHGPGATASLRGYGIVASDKFEKPLSMTVELMPYFKSILSESWHEAHSGKVDVIYGSKFTTVPKNAKTDRGICAEPTLNMYVQRGIGKYIRNRLRRNGLDLRYQGRNSELARRAWKDGLATIDLSAASDSLSSELILSYLPDSWVQLLSLCRCHRVFIDGEWHELEKFSSMGNGYTFELESLIFYAVCTAIVPRRFSADVGVYGDDIVIPASFSTAVIEALKFLGFSVNQSKSFLAGNFYESCGTDYFKGTEVRPFYLKGYTQKDQGLVPYQLRIANRLRNYAHKRGDFQYCDERFRSLWVRLFQSLPRMWRKCKVPPSFGDLGVVTSKSEARVKRLPHQHEGFSFLSISFTPKKVEKRTHFVLLSLLSQGCSTDVATFGREPRRGYLGKAFPKKSSVSHWTDSLLWGP